jgi:hypothetical protein
MKRKSKSNSEIVLYQTDDGKVTKLDAACPPIKYLHRALKDGDVYFFFNESNETQSRTATLAGTGQVQVWDATSGTIQPLDGVAPAAGSVAVPLTLTNYEARFIVLKR